MSTKKERDAAKAHAIERLREILPVGSRVWTMVVHVARSGMSRDIVCLAMHNNEIWDISYNVGRALGYRTPKNGGVSIRGCGMDMCFALVHELAYVLYPERNGTKDALEYCRL